jgi:hypothetical protein
MITRKFCSVVCIEDANNINNIIANPFLNYSNAYIPVLKKKSISIIRAETAEGKSVKKK